VAVTATFRVAPGLARFIPMLVAVAAIEALLAARLPAPPGTALWNLDIPKIDAPLAVFFHEALQGGGLPLWNDRLGLGFPLYAEGQIGAFYPPNWLIFRLEPLAALDLSRVVHLVAAGVGTGLLAIRLTGSRSGAIVATTIAVLGGAIVTKLEWTNLVAAYAWLPWVLLPLSRRPAPTRAGLVGAAIAWGIQALAGHPNVWLLTGACAAVLLLATGRDRRSVGQVLVFGLVGGAIGSIQLLPTLVLTGLSVRGEGLSANDVFTSAATVFDPLAFGFAQPFVRGGAEGWDIFTTWYPDGIFALYEASAFVGLAALALAAVGVTARRARPWLAVAAVMLAVPIVAAFRPEIWLEIPLLNGLRSPVRSYLVVALIVGIIAAIGLSRTGRAPASRGLHRASLTVAAFIAIYLVTLAIAGLAPDVFEGLLIASSSGLSPEGAAARRELAIHALAEPMPLIAELAAGIGALIVLGMGRRRGVEALGLVALVILPLALFSPAANAIRPREDAWPYDSELATTLRSLDPNRVLTLGAPGFYVGSPDRLAAAGIPDLDMFSSLNLLASDQLLERARTGEDAELVRQLVGVDVLVTFDRPCPGSDAQALGADGAVVCRVPAIRAPYWLPPEAVALGLVQTSPLAPSEATIDPSRAVSVARPLPVIAATDTELVIRSAQADPGYVWIDRAWWPWWRVEVDGRSAPRWRALAGQLVDVSGGTHEIRLTLIPWDALVWLSVAVVALLAAVVWIVRGRRDLSGPVGARAPTADGGSVP
jgi:hypothetical protein